MKETLVFDNRIDCVCKTSACVNQILCKTCVAIQRIPFATLDQGNTKFAVHHENAYTKTPTLDRLFDQNAKHEISRFVMSMLLQEDTIPMA